MNYIKDSICWAESLFLRLHCSSCIRVMNRLNDPCPQLRDPKVRKMAELLERTNSSYFPSFKNIFREVVEGRFIVFFQIFSHLYLIRFYPKKKEGWYDFLYKTEKIMTFVLILTQRWPKRRTSTFTWSRWGTYWRMWRTRNSMRASRWSRQWCTPSVWCGPTPNITTRQPESSSCCRKSAISSYKM